MYFYRGYVIVDFCYRGFYYIYIFVVSEAMIKCFENDRKFLFFVVLIKFLFIFLKMKVVLKRLRLEFNGLVYRNI